MNSGMSRASLRDEDVQCGETDVLNLHAVFRIQGRTMRGDDNDGYSSKEGASFCSFVVIHDRGGLGRINPD